MSQNKCVAIILAGGKSERMGQPKGLLKYKDHYWLVEHLNRLKSGGINDVILGLGFDAEAYYKAFPKFKKALRNTITYKGLQIKVVQNENPELGSFSTLQCSLKALDKSCDVLICPIDVPMLNSKELKNILKTHANIVKPSYKGQNGHPIKISYKFVEKLIYEDVLGRLDTIINLESEQEIKIITCSDKQIIMNLNTPSDWLTYKERV